MPYVTDSEVPLWGSQNKAAGNFGTVEKSQEAKLATLDEIPLIDVSGIFSPNLNDRKKVAEELRDACIKIGFFYITGHGIPQEQVDGVFEAGKSFFDLTFEEKMECFINNVPNYRGYTPIGGAGSRGVNGKGSKFSRFTDQRVSSSN